MAAKFWIISLVDSVFPAPDSPLEFEKGLEARGNTQKVIREQANLMTTHWFFRVL
jgi:hypothetical protein